MTLSVSKFSGAKTALVVDDDNDARDFYADYLTGKGINVKTAKDGKEALDIMRREKVHFVITDLAMPGMSGEEMMEEMTKDKKLQQIPLLVETALGTPGMGRDQKAAKQFEGRLRLTCFTRGSSSWQAVQRTILQLLEEKTSPSK